MNDSHTSQLHARGFRITPQRLAILRILNDSNTHLTPLQVYQQAYQVMPGITEATVYRTLNFLSEQGLALAAHIGDGQFVFVTPEHNHLHIICRDCRQMLEIDQGALRLLCERFQSETGYWIETGHITLFGLCPDCQKGREPLDNGQKAGS